MNLDNRKLEQFLMALSTGDSEALVNLADAWGIELDEPQVFIDVQMLSVLAQHVLNTSKESPADRYFRNIMGGWMP